MTKEIKGVYLCAKGVEQVSTAVDYGFQIQLEDGSKFDDVINFKLSEINVDTIPTLTFTVPLLGLRELDGDIVTCRKPTMEDVSRKMHSTTNTWDSMLCSSEELSTAIRDADKELFATEQDVENFKFKWNIKND